jgi:MFS family permease
VSETQLCHRADAPHSIPAKREPAQRTDLCAGLGDGTAFSVMVGMGETYLPAFALAAGLGEVAAGLVATIPLLAGGTLQLAAPWGLRRFGSLRRWVVVLAACQGLCFLPLALAAWHRRVPALLLFTAAATYWGCGLATGPAWNTWVGTLVPRRLRAAYFARRTRFSQAGLLVGFVGGGVALELAAPHGAALDVFACLFLAATMFRLVSVWFLSSQRELVSGPARNHSLHLGDAISRLRGSTTGRLLFYLLAVQTAVQISGPYFNPYMLQHLRFSYAQYVVLVAAAYASRIVALPALGRFAQRFGTRRLLWLGGVGIAPMSAAWLISNHFVYLIGLQLVVGVVWAAYELSIALLFFEAIPEQHRTSVLTLFNFANAAATVVGSLAGGLALVYFGKIQIVYLTLFALSSVARLAALGLLWRVPAATDDGFGSPLSPLPIGASTPHLQPLPAATANSGRAIAA